MLSWNLKLRLELHFQSCVDAVFVSSHKAGPSAALASSSAEVTVRFLASCSSGVRQNFCVVRSLGRVSHCKIRGASGDRDSSIKCDPTSLAFQA